MSARILKWKTSDADAIYWNNYWGETGKVCSWPNVLLDDKSMPDRYAHKQIKPECIIKWAEINYEVKERQKNYKIVFWKTEVWEHFPMN